MRAKRENSSTSCLSPSTSWMIVAVASSSRRFSSGRAVAAEPPAQALRGELDRGERVLDLVRDPLRDLAPRGEALGLQQLGEVVEHEHHAHVRAVGALERGRRGEERDGLAVAAQVHLALERALAQARHALDEGDDVRVLRPPEHRRSRAGPRRRARGCPSIRSAALFIVLTRPVGVERHDAGGHRLQHGLGVAAPPLHLAVLGLEVEVRLLELGLGRGEVRRHPVEGVDEDADLVVRAHLDLVVEVARGTSRVPSASIWIGSVMPRAR